MADKQNINFPTNPAAYQGQPKRLRMDELDEAASNLATATASERTTPQADQLPADLAVTDEERTRKWFVGSIDQGTTSSRFIIFDGDGVPVASHQLEFENLYPQSG